LAVDIHQVFAKLAEQTETHTASVDTRHVASGAADLTPEGEGISIINSLFE
jgi:hypothetical protein